jgi:hypothetical protein
MIQLKQVSQLHGENDDARGFVGDDVVWQQLKRATSRCSSSRAMITPIPPLADPIQKTVVSENFAENGPEPSSPLTGYSGKPTEVAAGIVILARAKAS